jgi:hypothetical protein
MGFIIINIKKKHINVKKYYDISYIKSILAVGCSINTHKKYGSFVADRPTDLPRLGVRGG